jgi:four helix bundle protein
MERERGEWRMEGGKGRMEDGGWKGEMESEAEMNKMQDRERREVRRERHGTHPFSTLRSPSSNFHSPSSDFRSPPSAYVGCEPWEFDGEKWVPRNAAERKRIQSHRDLEVFNLAYTLAMEVFYLTRRFPREERYALTDQMRRSSRSVCSNIVEGFAKRRYENVFKNSLNDSLGESEETKLWLDFSLDCGYIQADDHRRLTAGYEQVGAMLWALMTRWESLR